MAYKLPCKICGGKRKESWHLGAARNRSIKESAGKKGSETRISVAICNHCLVQVEKFLEDLKYQFRRMITRNGKTYIFAENGVDVEKVVIIKDGKACMYNASELNIKKVSELKDGNVDDPRPIDGEV